MLRAFFFLVGAFNLGASALAAPPLGEPLPRSNYGAALEDDDVILHGIGQKEELSIADYSGAMPEEMQPILWMHYYKLHPEETPQRARDFVARLAQTLSHYPGEKRLQIALSFDDEKSGPSGTRYSGIGAAAEAGDYDECVKALAEALAELDIPIYVRIGYEFNGHWNVYTPGQYQRVFIRFADFLKRAMGDSVAILWCCHPISKLDEIMTFYPGDEHVDWWSIDLFAPKFLKSQNTEDFIKEAARRRKPVFIAESTPEGVGVHDLKTWKRWMNAYLGIMYRNPNVKAFNYIHRNWAAWSWSEWGDSRLSEAPEAMALWQQELSKPVFRHAGPTAAPKTNPLASVRGIVNHPGEKQIELGADGIELDFGPSPVGAEWHELSLALKPAEGEGEVTVRIYRGKRELGSFAIAMGKDLRLYDVSFETAGTGAEPLKLRVVADQPCSLNGPAVGAEGIAPALISAGAAPSL